MNNIESYRKKFYSLLESTFGDVKTLIVEQQATTQTPATPAEQPYLSVDGYDFFIVKNPVTNKFNITVKQGGVDADKNQFGAFLTSKNIKTNPKDRDYTSENDAKLAINNLKLTNTQQTTQQAVNQPQQTTNQQQTQQVAQSGSLEGLSN